MLTLRGIFGLLCCLLLFWNVVVFVAGIIFQSISPEGDGTCELDLKRLRHEEGWVSEPALQESEDGLVKSVWSPASTPSKYTLDGIGSPWSLKGVAQPGQPRHGSLDPVHHIII